MTRETKFVTVLVTAPDVKTARQLARKALGAKLAACVNLIPGVESHYWWEGKINSGREILMVLKTSGRKVKALEKLVLAEHPYDTPEFVALTIGGGSKRYLEWIAGAVKEWVNGG
jgi:periplasmic divalent cation tolerance protein